MSLKRKIRKRTCVSGRIRFVPALLIFVLGLFCPEAKAQIGIMAGGSYTHVRHNGLLKGVQPKYNTQLGIVSVRYRLSPGHTKFTLQNDLMISGKGFKQHLDKSYEHRFTYLCLPVLLNYEIVHGISVKAGFEPSLLTGVSRWQNINVYRRFDVGLVFGSSFLEKQAFNIYARMVYGLVPMLNYDAVDALGNFRKINDLQNFSVSLGIKWNIHERLSLHQD